MELGRSRARFVRGQLAARLVLVLVALFSAGWLNGSSCVAVYCSEDCDPCISQCKCSNVCNHTHATFQATHALTDFFVVEHPSDGKRAQRTFTEIVGLSVERAGGPAWPADEFVIRFARGVLAVNPQHLALRDAPPEFALDSVLRYETATVLMFHQSSLPDRENLITFLFDPRGNLVEIDQALGE
jgi:hypothetical protein